MDTNEYSEIENNDKFVLDQIGHESICVYCFIKDNIFSTDVTNNYILQFVYRSFYGLDTAGLTPDFKKRYFELMQEYKTKSIDIKDILLNLYRIKNYKKQNTLQFSFVSKLANTIDHNLPIYDSEVAKYFKYSPASYLHSIENRIESYMTFYNILKIKYKTIIDENKLQIIRSNFKSKYLSSTSTAISESRILDFIFWSAGKLKLKVN